MENIRFLKKFSKIALWGVVSLVLLCIVEEVAGFSFICYHKPAYRGKVIDSETKAPIEGAVVVAYYNKAVIGPNTVIIKIRETLTDQNGEYYIPPYRTLISPISAEDDALFLIYKPGYAPLRGMALYRKSHFLIPPHGINDTVRKSMEWGWEYNPTKKLRVHDQVVELPKLTTRDDRLKAVPSREDDGMGLLKQQILLLQKINEEGRNIGFGLLPMP